MIPLNQTSSISSTTLSRTDELVLQIRQITTSR